MRSANPPHSAPLRRGARARRPRARAQAEERSEGHTSRVRSSRERPEPIRELGRSPRQDAVGRRPPKVPLFRDSPAPRSSRGARIGRPEGARERGAASLGTSRPRFALLTDVWYTLLYYPVAVRKRIEAARRRTWLRALAEAGLSRSRSREVVARLGREIRASEHRGRTPALATRVRRLARQEGISLAAQRLVAALDRLVAENPPRVAPGARTALRILRSHGVRIGIVSNVTLESGAGARRLLERLRLTALVDVVVLSTDDGIAKPDPRLFLRCLRRLKVDPSRAWYLGDLPTDVRGAVAAGVRPIRFVGLERFAPSVRATWPIRAPVVRRWRELPAWLFGQPSSD
jgi:FMN phosphatase YigB (HAD superfamily)